MIFGAFQLKFDAWKNSIPPRACRPPTTNHGNHDNNFKMHQKIGSPPAQAGGPGGGGPWENPSCLSRESYILLVIARLRVSSQHEASALADLTYVNEHVSKDVVNQLPAIGGSCVRSWETFLLHLTRATCACAHKLLFGYVYTYIYICIYIYIYHPRRTPLDPLKRIN